MTEFPVIAPRMATGLVSGVAKSHIVLHVSSAAQFRAQVKDTSGTEITSGSFFELTKKPGMEQMRSKSSFSSFPFGGEVSHSKEAMSRSAKSKRYVGRQASGNPSLSAAVQERAASQNGAVSSQMALQKEVESRDTMVYVERGLMEQTLINSEPLTRGGLIDNGVVYREKFVIRCYEVGANRTASMETMANLLQEVGCNHAQCVGFSTDGFATTPLMRERGLIWVTTRMHVEVTEYPVWGDTVEIDTWFQVEGRIETRRDWLIRDDQTGRVIGRSTSTWVMMKVDTRKLARIADDVRDELRPHSPLLPRWAFSEDNDACMKKIGMLKDPAQYVRPNLTPRRGDLDMNQHVNNVTYIGWMLEGMPREITATHELTQITLGYRRECKADDVVESLISPETPETHDLVDSNQTSVGTSGSATPESSTTEKPGIKVNGSSLITLSNTNGALLASSRANTEMSKTPLHFLHLLRLSGGGVEINRGRTEWRRKTDSLRTLKGD